MITSFITTAIPYVNARPHLGFAYELVIADVLARHHRRRGRDVRFITGTDDNSLKNVVAAQREGLTPRALVDRNAAAFAELGRLLNVATDDFIRTSSDPRHLAAVDWLWRACSAAGDLYVQRWQGRYCAGCEAFVDDDVAICAEHGTAPEPVSEPNWFFRLFRTTASRFATRSPRADSRSFRTLHGPRSSGFSTAKFATSACRASPPDRAAGASRCPTTRAR
jgi:methionyl-tRNA synthetase